MPVSAKFCPECAHPVSGTTASPSRFAAPESYTPKHLAEKILTSKTALEGERKQVTVLFADLKGSMELLADRDPEEARKLLDPVLERMMEAVHRYEGTVNQVMGDGIMALFGAPLAHEDHAVRACYAALRMQESVAQYAESVFRSHGVPVQIRVGLNSGEVVVRAIGSDLHMDYTAVGQTTHLAARMEQMATPGTILLAPATLRLAEGYVQVAGRGPVAVKGLPEPVEIYALTGASAQRTRLHAAAARGLTRFVGRDAEIEQLRRALALAQDGHGQLVAIVGEPGVGKSRLLYEFTHSHRIQDWLILEAGSVSYGKATSYLPVIDLLKAYFKVHDRETHREIREKVTGKLLTLDRTLEPILPALLALLDVPVENAPWQALDPAQRRQRTLDAVKHLLLRESQEQPILVVFEDLHWIDTETQALLDSLVESLPTARLLLLVNYRPEYEHEWGRKTYYSQLRLDALPPESAGDLLSALLGDDPALEPLKRLLVRRGNPFFIEESIRTLVETQALIGERGAYRLTRPIQAIEVPATVQVILAARIDRLPAENKQLLQTASVIGKDVPLVLLHAVAEAAEDAVHRGLAHLQAAEFLYETRLFPDPEYTFKHALTHEVTYGTLLQDQRKALHARIVGAIERCYPDRLTEHVDRLAHHAIRGELREKAAHYLRQAGLKAAVRSALPDARLWFEQALIVLRALPDSVSTVEQAFEICLELRSALVQLGEIQLSLERLREADSLAERLNDSRRRSRVYALTANTYTLSGELDEALSFGTRARTLAEAAGDLDLRITTATCLEQVHYFRGEYEQVVELATDNLASLPADRAHEFFGSIAPASVYNRYWLILSLAPLGRFAEAAQSEAEATRLAEPMQHLYTSGVIHLAASTIHLLKGEWAKARPRIEGGISLFRSGHVSLLLPRLLAYSAWVLAQAGETGEALNRIREGERLLAGRTRKAPAACLYLGHAYRLLGRLDEARILAEYAAESQEMGVASQALHLLGDIATDPDRFNAESGEAHYSRAWALAERLGMRPFVAHCHLGLGKVYQRTGRREQALDHLTTATTMYREMDMRFWLEQAEAELRELV
jgi:class 3 adenylate cyclase/tetratricopeptide (TPR) repeat protein